jgi:prepilin-type N-terminal cleavage/methylation domain-containing protein/prepilin-type processing-associated H-X9-DG protein
MKTQAFTLIELLVVIAIIAVLASLLAPSLMEARFNAYKTACASNLHHMGVAIALYVASSEGLMPPMGERWWSHAALAGAAGGGRGLNWIGILDQANEVDLRWLICPMDNIRLDPTADRLLWTPTQSQVTGGSLSQFHWSYAALCVGYELPGRRVPWSGTRNGMPVGSLKGPFHFDNMPSPTSMHLVWDGYFLSLNQRDGIRAIQVILNSALGGARKQQWQDFYRHLFRHNRHPHPNTPEGPNALFADGHVEITTDIFALDDRNTTVAW